VYVYLSYLPTTSIKIDILKTSINNDYTMQIYKNVKEIGIEKPIIVDEAGRCLLGTTRVRAAILLKISTLKTIVFTAQHIKNSYHIKDYDELLKLSKLSSKEFFNGVIKPYNRLRL
jgi:hypothetical protein